LHYQIPWAHYHKYRVVADIASKRIRSLIEDQDRIALEKDGVMTWQKRVRENGRDVYINVRIYSGAGGIAGELSRGKQRDSAMLVTADKAWFEFDSNTNNITMALEGVYVPATRTLVGGSPRLTINLYEMIRSKTRNEGDRDLRSDSLLSEVYRGVHREPLGAQYTVHRRACFALMPFLLAPIGFCIGVLSRERGRVLALSFCMIPLALVYASDFLGESALRLVPWTFMGWLPAMVILILGIPFCWRLLRV